MYRLEDVTRTWPGRDGTPVHALRNVRLTIERGDFVTVVGPSGSGKSTLLFTLGGMLRPTSGTVLLDGVDLYAGSTGQRAALRRETVGFLFQTFNLLPYLSCLDNVVFPARLAGRRPRDAARRGAALLDRVGLSHRLHHRPAELSVGERQRVALCRSLVNDPAVLLADEPTGNLDPETTRVVMALLLHLHRQGQTIVMVTHDHELAAAGGRSVVLVDGVTANAARVAPRVSAGLAEAAPA